MQIISTSTAYLIGSAIFENAYIAVNSGYNLTLASNTNRPVGVSTNLQFQFSVAPDVSKWNICTNITTGHYCMDQWGDDAYQPALQKPGLFSGQQWTLTGKENGSGSTLWEFQSDFAGPLNFLEAEGLGLNTLTMDVVLGNFTFWRLVDLNQSTISNAILSATSASTSVHSSLSPATSLSSPFSTNSTALSSSPSSQNYENTNPASSGLSTGAKIGVAVGSASPVLLAAAVACWFIQRRRHTRQQVPQTEFTSEMDGQEVFEKGS